MSRKDAIEELADIDRRLLELAKAKREIQDTEAALVKLRARVCAVLERQRPAGLAVGS